MDTPRQRLSISGYDATKPYLGLTTFRGEHPNKRKAGIAKNYLDEKELEVLNRMVTAYLGSLNCRH